MDVKPSVIDLERAQDIASRNPLICGPCGGPLLQPKDCPHYLNGARPCCVPLTSDLAADIAVALAETRSDYEEVLSVYRERVRLLDVEMNGEGAARQASFVDIWDQLINCIRLSREVVQLDRVVEGEREARQKIEVAYRAKDEAMGVLFERLRRVGVDCSDLIS